MGQVTASQTLSTDFAPPPILEFGAVASPQAAAYLESVYQRDIGTGVGELVEGQYAGTAEQEAKFYSQLTERRSLA